MTPERLRELTGWPADVPDSLLAAHLAAAGREGALLLEREPDPAVADEADMVCWLAAASVVPLLHTFALSGAAKVGRLEGTVEWRFLDWEESRSLASYCRGEAHKCLVRIKSSETPSDGFFGAV